MYELQEEVITGSKRVKLLEMREPARFWRLNPGTGQRTCFRRLSADIEALTPEMQFPGRFHKSFCTRCNSTPRIGSEVRFWAW